MHWFARSLRDGLPVVIGAAIVVVAYLHARGMMHLVAAEVAAPPARRPFLVKPMPRPELVDPTPLLRRNPFDSTTGPLSAAPAASSSAPAAPQAPTKTPAKTAAKCDFGHVTTIVAGGEAYAFATIKTKDGKSHLHRRGDLVAEDHELTDIGPRQVWLRDGNDTCRMRLGDPIRVAKKRRPRKRRRKRRKRK